jgi:succinate dehydrogenase flavin-adding protein (antitoxin of CptAB toxin-antitoxin module)
MLLGGIDASGISQINEYSDIGFIITTEEIINSIYSDIGLKEIHMVRLDKIQKEHVIKILNNQKNDILAYCFHVERQNLVNNIFNNPRYKKKPGKKEHVYVEFDKIFLQFFRDELYTFCAKFKQEFSKLTVEHDLDMKDSIKRWNLVGKDKGKAFEIADAIAWCNTHRIELKICKEIDLSEKIQSQLMSNLLK